jgi:hypothetical protein
MTASMQVRIHFFGVMAMDTYSRHIDLDILSIDEHDHATSLDMEVKSVADVRKGVAHARTLLYEQIARGRWNTLIQEW